MAKVTEIRWHGRGGQGAVTAAKMMAETALQLDKFFQASPEYGAERMGAPIQAFTRISDERINSHSGVTEPDIVVVLDPTLLGAVDVTEGLPSEGYLIINTEMSPTDVREKFDIRGYQLFTVGASKIAVDTIGRAIPNTPMIGALLGATGIMDIEKVVEHIKTAFGKKFSAEIVEGNVSAIRRAFEEVRSE